jgi:hypothetical protein
MLKIQKSTLALTLSLLTIATVQAGEAPTGYECRGKNVNLYLTDGNFLGDSVKSTSFSLQIGEKSYNFADTEITNESTLIGDLWETTLSFIPDVSIEHASVVIPKIELGESPVSFKSQLILTRVATPFSNKPFVGVVNSSKYIDVNCTAASLHPAPQL